MDFEQFKKTAKLAKDNETYKIFDLQMERHILSLTELNPHKETRGHSHAGVEEVYYFFEGKGRILLGDQMKQVEAGNVEIIPDGIFHKVFNDSDKILRFFCFFEAYERN